MTHHSFGYSLHEDAAARKVRLGGYQGHPGWAVPYRQRLGLPGHEWANIGGAIATAAVLQRKGRVPMK